MHEPPTSHPRARLVVHFHPGDRASVVFHTDAPSREAGLVENLAVSCFILHQLTNIGRNDLSLGLASILAGWGSADSSTVVHGDRMGSRLGEHPGTEGERRFECDLELGPGACRFRLYPRGFGWRGKGLSAFTPLSVLLLLQHERKEHGNDGRRLDEIGRVVRASADVFLGGAAGLRNRSRLAYRVAVEGAGASGSDRIAA